MKNSFLNVIGMMTGTSMDGIDISLVKTDGLDLKNIKNYFFEYDHNQKKQLNQILKNKDDIIRNNKLYEEANNFVTKLHLKSLKNFSFRDNIDLIGFHGQTIHHDPVKKKSIQLGNPYLLSKESKKNIIYSFRSEDIKLGGQGAPIAPIYHKYLIDKFSFKLPSCFLNIGGILNLTYWDGKTLIGFDLGPGNCLMDDFIQLVSDNFFDKDGFMASKGTVDKKFAKSFSRDIFFQTKPPKSLDKNYFNNYLNALVLKNHSKENTMATLLELTIISIVNSLKFLPNKIKSLYLCGGGSKNKFLVSKIKDLFDDILLEDTILEIDPDFIESEMIAYLSARSFYKLPITFPKTTGVKVPLSGGKLIKIFNL